MRRIDPLIDANYTMNKFSFKQNKFPELLLKLKK